MIIICSTTCVYLFVCLFVHSPTDYHQTIIIWSSNYHQMIIKWSSDNHQITRFVCFLSVYNRWSLNDHQMITSWLPLVCLFVCLLSDNGWSSNDQQMISFVCLFVFLSVNSRWSLNDHKMITSWPPLFVCWFVCLDCFLITDDQ